jgi:hypothetical protein
MNDYMKELEAREVRRYQLTCDLCVVYEGATQEIPVHPPDLSTRGMFIHTPNVFPIGSVLKVRFRLQRSQFQVNVRAEVRHCKPGAGVGIEFLDLSPAAARAIEREIAL